MLSNGLTPAQDPKIGRDGKWQLSLYDPNLIRVELMALKAGPDSCCSPMLE